MNAEIEGEKIELNFDFLKIVNFIFVFLKYRCLMKGMK